ncbi:MAG TPA: hypothetical protein VKM55_08015 [Candidatus Lokiarchaeia archaeon]|nr:hypothetical protein [Candidatus Lokiarchaeia archaeon]
MDKIVYYKRLFLVAAIWNWAVAVLFFIISAMAPTSFETLGMAIPNGMAWFQSAMTFIGVFGVAFFIASRDPGANRGIVMSGVVEKFLIFIVLATYYFIGEVSIAVLLVVFVDLVFGFLFLENVLHSKKP